MTGETQFPESKQYNGAVARAAILIVQFDTRLSGRDLTRMLSTSKTTFWRMRTGRPTSTLVLNGLLYGLSEIREEYWARRSRKSNHQ